MRQAVSWPWRASKRCLRWRPAAELVPASVAISGDIFERERTMKSASLLGAVAIGALVAVLPAAAADQDALLKRGGYLVNGPVGCGNCHNTRAQDFSFVPGKEFAGGFHI